MQEWEFNYFSMTCILLDLANIVRPATLIIHSIALFCLMSAKQQNIHEAQNRELKVSWLSKSFVVAPLIIKLLAKNEQIMDKFSCR